MYLAVVFARLLRLWQATETPRRVGVSAFGFSGTNAHVILEEAPTVSPVEVDEDISRVNLLLVSARDDDALRAQAHQLAAWLKSHPTLDWRDLVYSAASRRTHFDLRAAVMGAGPAEVEEALVALQQGVSHPAVVKGSGAPAGKCAFLFSGQGSQLPGMGRGLYEQHPVFRRAFDEVVGALDAHLPTPLGPVVFAEAGSAGAALLDTTEYTQPALFALEVAQYRLWESFGVRPDFMMGHSLGELAAAHVAGVITLEDAAKLVSARGRLMQACRSDGAMASLEATEGEVRKRMAPHAGEVDIAGLNGPRQTVISGTESTVMELMSQFETMGRRATRLNVSHAFHSPHMDSMLEEMRAVSSTCKFHVPTIALISGVTGERFRNRDLLSVGYWARQVRQGVRFLPAMQALEAEGVTLFVECGPAGTLSAMGSDCLGEGASADVIPTARKGRDEQESLSHALARLHTAGGDVNWEAVTGGGGASGVILPTYAFQRERHWLEERVESQVGAGGSETEQRWWSAVAAGSAEEVSELLGLPSELNEEVEALMPHLAAWRTRVEGDQALQGWLYTEGWTPLPEAAREQEDPLGTWLLVAPESARSVSEGLREVIEAAGGAVVEWSPGLDREYLVARLKGLSMPLTRVVALSAWAVDVPSDVAHLPLGLQQTLVLVQALLESEVSAPLWILTQGAVSVNSDDLLLRPLQNLLWGLGRAVGCERPEHFWGLVDLPEEIDERTLLRLVQHLRSVGDEDQIALRAGGAFSRRLLRADSTPTGPAWEPRGTVVITGGTGALGQHAARRLSERGVEHLVLTSRRGEHAPGAQALKAELEARGTRVTLAACDVSEREQVRELLSSLDRGDTPLTAIIHAAGVVNLARVEELGAEHLALELAAKVSGAWHLHELLGDRSLDAFILYSSIASLWGSSYHAAYGAANAALDALALHRRRQGLSATTLWWGPWADAGMVSEGDGSAEAELRKRGLSAMGPEQALRGLELALTSGEGALGVVDVRWERFAPVFTSQRASPFLSGVPEAREAMAGDLGTSIAGAASAFQEEVLRLPEAARGARVRSVVAEVTATVLGLKDVSTLNTRTGFLDLGLDSLMTVELRRLLQERSGVATPSTLAFDYPTVDAAAQWLLGELTRDQGEQPAAREVSAAGASLDEPIAIVGVGLRLPGGVTTLDELWQALSDERDTVTPVPHERFDVEAIYDADPDAPGSTYLREGSFVDDVASFDAGFFGISPREAISLDPQHRLLLETGWTALEDAGLRPADLQGSETGVFVGVGPNEYGQHRARPREAADAYSVTGSGMSFAAGRLAYHLGLQGPALSVDTACSSSLVALHLATQSLRNGRCDVALVAGVQVLASPDGFILLSRTRAVAPDGRCKTFSAAADGYGRGEGVGVLVTMRLADARAQNRRVLGVVRGSAVNHDGASSGITAPNGTSQQKVLRSALRDAGLAPRDVDVIECHGTGTRLGDPIEVQALAAVYGEGRDAAQPLQLGTVKTNVGHLESAAGVAGVLKVLASLHHEGLPASLHASPLNPHVDWESLPVEVVSSLKPWPRSGRVRRAGVSAFGLSGTNAHVIIEEPQGGEEIAPARGEPNPFMPLLLSARDERALQVQAGRWAQWLQEHPEQKWGAMLRNAALARTHFDCRAAMRVSDHHEALVELRGLAEGTSSPRTSLNADPVAGGLAFLFTGQGSQCLKMGRDLYDTFPVFASVFDELGHYLDAHLERPLRSVMFAERGSEEAALLGQTAFTQPALFAFEVALAALWRAWGVEPAVLLGHSIGELSAACVSGVLSREDAARLVCARGRLMQACRADGRMVSLQASELEVLKALEEGGAGVDIAGLNAPNQTVISGDAAAVLQVAERFEALGLKTTTLDVSHAFHSAHMEEMLEDFHEVARGCVFNPPQIPIVSNVTGEEASGEELASPAYWVRQVRSAVRFVDGMQTLHGQGVTTFVECGPRGVLCGMGAACLVEESPRFVVSHRKGRPEARTLLAALSEVHVAGHDVDWRPVLQAEAAERVELPTYAFMGERFWLEESARAASSAASTTGRWALAGHAHALPGGGALHILEIGPGIQAYLGDHQVYGKVVVPGAFYVAVMLSVAATRWPDQAVEVSDVQFVEALWFDSARERVTMHVHLQPQGPDRFGVTLAAYRKGEWITHATGAVGSSDEVPVERREPSEAAAGDVLDTAGMLEVLEAYSIDWGPRWVWLQSVEESAEGRVGRLQVPPGVPVDAPIPGGLLDNSFSVPFLHEALREKDRVPRLPFGLKRLVWFGAAEEITDVSGDARAMGKDLQVSELSWWDARGGLVARLEGFTARRAPKDLFLRGATLPLYQVAWQEAERVVQSLEPSSVVLGGDGQLAETLGLAHVSDLDGVLALSSAPARVVVAATAVLEGEVVDDVYRTTLQTLRRLQRWFSEASLGESEAVWVTREALRTEAAVEEALVAPVSGAYRLEILERGRLDRLGFSPEAVGAVSPGTVRVRTQAVGLNFRFIIDALGMFPGDAGLVGGDGVGVVTEVGAGVTHLAEGDRVLGLLDAVSESVVNASLLTRIPDALSFAEAATLPVAFITVAYGLRDLGRLRRGERVLIHAGAGGVGMVAVQYARHLGAEVFATASPPKWDALRAMGLDDAHIASSRDADFLERFQETTGGAGVDVVLNSLAGALTDAGLALLSEGGRFLEMGKTDLREPEAVAATHPGVEYTVFDIMPLILNEPERVATMLADAAQGYSEGWLHPLPVEVFPAARAPVAFRWMAQARHIGKVVLSFGETDVGSAEQRGGLASAGVGGLLRTARQENTERRIRWVDVDSATPDPGALSRALIAVEEPEVALRGDEVLVPRLRRCGGDEDFETRQVGGGSVLITGGTGDLGAELARHLVTNHGVTHLVLTSRRGLDAAGAPELVEELVGLGAESVLVPTCDVAQWDDVKQLDAALVEGPPLRDVFHLAGVIDDGLLGTLTPERVETVLSPKVKGTWNLHRWTRERALTHFVVFSSFSGLTGNPGQGSYAAANVFMDALMAHRREAGLPGLSLAWGPWSTGGMLATLSDAERTRMERAGMVPLSAEEGFELMDRAMARPESVLVSAHLDPAQVQRQVNQGAPLPSLFKSLVSAKTTSPGLGPAGASALQRRLAALPVAEREASLLETLRSEVAQVLGLASGRSVNPTTSLQELGADSLMSVELRNRLVALTGATLPTTLVFDYPTTEALTGFILTQLDLKDAPQGSGRPRRPAAQQLDEPIAVVSMACRFPGGVEDPEALWELLREGGDAITEVPKTRFDVNAVFDEDPDAVGKTYTRWGGFVGDVDAFDAAFFGISPREAKSIDPQERLLLETTWELFERVGILPRSLVGSLTGVYLGISGNEYIQMAGMDPDSADAYSVLGTIHSAVAGRLSYWLGLEGPNMPVDTACSSSLVSLHLACQGLRQGECDMAIAGGVNLLLSAYGYVYFSRLKAMSPTGRCHAFSEDADGYVRAEGCGVLLLKRLSDAQADGDEVLALIRGSAVNQDGQSNGFTAPNGPAQQAVIRRALAVADLAPASVDYVECHGTGTALGDPIEVQALGAVYGEERPLERPVVLGTVKSNIGHTESAAGVAGLMKVILSLNNDYIPQTLHVGTPNPRIPWDTLPVQIAVQAQEWTPGTAPRRAGVSSFGFSGTNAHVVLEEAPSTRDATPLAPAAPGYATYPLLLSGESADALVGQADRLLGMLEGTPALRLEDLAFSLATTRTHFDHRAALSAGDVGTLKRALLEIVDHRELPASVLRSPEELVEGRLVFLFTGQGSQRPGMGQALYGEYPVFKQALDDIAAAMAPHLEEPLLPVLFDADSERLHQTQWTQPALFALEVALYRLWESWGVVPDLLIGHSVGELAAAHVAGVMSLEDAAHLVVARGRLMQALPGGGTMASLALDEDTTGELLKDLGVEDAVSIAGLNAPAQSVVSGDTDAVEQVVERCEAMGHRAKRLVVSHAFHSQRMEPMLEAFAEVAGSVTFAAPKIPLVSNVSGTLADEAIASADYWTRHVREPVRFCDGIRVAMERGAATFVELGPSPVLSGLGARCVGANDAPAWLPSLRARREEGATLQEAVSRVHVRGHGVNWAGFFAPVAARSIPLPVYAFQRKRYWLDPKRSTAGGLPGQYPGHNDLAGSFCVQPDGGWLHFIPVGPSHQPYLSDHIIHGQSIVAGAFHVGVLLAVAEEHFGAEGFVVEQIRFLRPLLADTDQVLQVALTSDDGGASYRARTLMLEEDDGVVAQWALFVEGVIIPGGAAPVKAHTLESARALCTESVDVAGYYADLAAVNIVWDPLWRWTLQAFAGPGGEGGFLELGPPEGLLSGNLPLHPVAIDNGFAALKLGMEVGDDEETPQLPFAVDRIAWHRQPRGRLWTYTMPLELGDDHSRFDLTFWDEDGELVAEFFSCTIKRAPEELMLANAGASALDRWMFQVDWRAVERPTPAVEGSVALWARREGVLLEDVQRQLNDAGIDVIRLSEISAASAEPVSMVLALWEGDDDVKSSAHGVSADALAQLQTLMGGDLAAPVVWITRDAVGTGEADTVSGVGTSALWGLGRVARNESVDLALRLLDVDDGGEGLVEALSLKDEPECALRAGELLSPRLMKNAAPAPSDAPLVKGEGTVLITGGLGALGQEVARYLVNEQGVKHLLLTSRRGMGAPGAEALVQELRDAGAQVAVAGCDVSERASLDAALSSVEGEHPLCGVIHLAGLLDDGTLSELDSERLHRVLTPKVDGAWNLHQATRDLTLDLFVLFSSATGIIGGAGQGNYAAANAFLDALAQHRQAQGLAGLSIAWGPWASGGMAAGLDDADKARMRRQGLGALEVAAGMSLLKRSLEQPHALSVVMALDPGRLQQSIERSGGEVPALYRGLIRIIPSSGTSASELRARLEALPEEEQLDEILAAIKDEIALVLGLSSGREVGANKSLQDLGIDSLMAVELSKRMVAMTNVKLPATLIFDYPTPAAIAGKLMTDLNLTSAGTTGATDKEKPPAARDLRERGTEETLDVDALTDDQVEDALDAILGELG